MNKYTSGYIVERSEMISSILFSAMKNHMIFTEHCKNEDTNIFYEGTEINCPSTVFSELNKLENIKSVLSHSNTQFMKTVVPGDLTGFNTTRLLENTRVDEDMIINKVDDNYDNIDTDRALFKDPKNITRFNIPIIKKHECPKEVIHGQNTVDEAKKVITTFESAMDDLISKCREVSKHFSTTVDTINNNIEVALSDTLYSNMLAAELEACRFITKDAVQSQIISVKLESELEKLANARAILVEAYMYNPFNRFESLENGESFGEREYTRVMELAERASEDSGVKAYEEAVALNDKISVVTEGLTDTNKKVLEKYEKAALASNCAGIYIDKFYEIKDLKKISDDSYKKGAKEIEDLIGDWNRMSVGKREISRLSTLFQTYHKRSMSLAYSSADIQSGVVEKLNYKLRKEDVKQAVHILKTAPGEIKSHSAAATKAIQRVGAKGFAEGLLVQISAIPLASDLSKYKQCALNVYRDQVEYSYHIAMVNWFKRLQKQSKKIVILAARGSDSVTESMVKRFKSDDENIDSLLESIKIDEAFELQFSVNESKNNTSDRKKAHDTALAVLKKELNKYSELKTKGTVGNKSNDVSAFIDGSTDHVCIFTVNAWDLVPNARQDMYNGSKLMNAKIYDPLAAIFKSIEDKLPKNYKVEDYGDWDDIYIYLVCTK